MTIAGGAEDCDQPANYKELRICWLHPHPGARSLDVNLVLSVLRRIAATKWSRSYHQNATRDKGFRYPERAINRDDRWSQYEGWAWGAGSFSPVLKVQGR